MKIIPVLDIQHGVVVRGVAGERDGYQPIESCLTESSEPVEVLSDLQTHFGPTPFYVADLDAIRFDRRNAALWKTLAATSDRIWLDCGVHDLSEAAAVAEGNVDTIVVALETVQNLSTACRIIREFRSRIVFSIDLADGRSLASAPDWQGVSPLEISRQLIDCGCRRFIVLDLKAVGVAAGVPTIALCRKIRELAPDCEITTGGGVRSMDDLLLLHDEGIDGVLIASALHNGSISAAELRRCGWPSNG